MVKRNIIISGADKLFREGLSLILESSSVAVLAEVPFFAESLAFLKSTEHEISLLICCPPENDRQNFDELLLTIAREFPAVALVMLTDTLDHADFRTAINGGVKAFFPKTISSAALQTALELILLGGRVFDAPKFPMQEVVPAAWPEPMAAPSAMNLIHPLSPRETQILDCLVTGLPNKMIARNLDMAEATVKVHLKTLLRKINVENRTQAAVWGMRQQSFAGGVATVTVSNHL
jgi:two-component system nitrate/nitrite response regulator NarL